MSVCRANPLIVSSEPPPITPEAGRAVGDEIVRKLEGLQEPAVLPIDLGQLEYSTTGWIREAIINPLRRTIGGDIAGRYIVLMNMHEEVRSAVDQGLLAKDRKRDTVCIHIKRNGRSEILGSLPELDAETYMAAKSMGTITARALADSVGIRIAAASNRLARLRDLHLLIPIESDLIATGGRHLVYEPLT